MTVASAVPLDSAVPAEPGSDSAASSDASHVALMLQAVVLSHDAFDPSATAFATAMARAYGCARVAIGFVRGSHVELKAVSHALGDTLCGGGLDAIAAAMDEATQQGASVRWPAAEGGRSTVRIAHARWWQRQGGAVATVPLIHAGDIAGAVSCEWTAADEPTAERFARIETTVSLVGPVLNLMRLRETPWRERAWQAARRGLRALRRVDDRRAQACLALVLAGAALLCALPMPYRVGGHARIEGAEQRALVAPTDGYLKAVHVRPGDRVAKGQPLVELADQDLALQRRKWASELSQQESAHAIALARADRSALVVAMARADQARAQLALVDGDIARANVVAPFDGVVVQGDLAQSIGSPVERGKPLLMIAPGDAFRVVIEVDERDVAEVRQGQRGTLALAALPWESLSIAIGRVTPIARAVDGNNVFDLVVGASDGVHTTSLSLSVAVTPVDETPPVITSNGGGMQAQITLLATGATVDVTQVLGRDADLPGSALRYSIDGGADAARFVIDPASGQLSLAAKGAALSPTATGTHDYDVIVGVSDGTYTTVQHLTVRIATVVAPAVPTADSNVTSTAAPASATTASAASATTTLVESARAAAQGPAPAKLAARVGAIVAALPAASDAARGVAPPTPARDPTSRSAGPVVAAPTLRLPTLDLGLRSFALGGHETGIVDAVGPTLADPRVAMPDASVRGVEVVMPTPIGGIAADDGASGATTINSTTSVGIALSLGVVGWAARGVTLLASVFVSSPAWRSYDLLPVLRRRDDEADWGDDAEGPDAAFDDGADASPDRRRQAVRAGRRDRVALDLE